ncbi:MAG: protein phosphatase CheZ, partial [Gammaproteobacteria bacterium]|nr:protein phosphatase CheZ [Gammaproteobacteria bacterium]
NIARAKDLLACMERGDEQGAREVLEELARIRETELYQEMGKLTRELHDSISAFGMDNEIINLAKDDIPDARSRLRYVIELTDDAANKTLTSVEKSIPLCDGMSKNSRTLNESWKRFIKRDMDVNEFRELSASIDKFLEDNTEEVTVLRTHLSNILLAQDFQDLTSQIIKRVIDLVEDVESNLVNLIKLTGSSAAKDLPDVKKPVHDTSPQGPAVPGVDQGVVSGQDEVDELLSSLGF